MDSVTGAVGLRSEIVREIRKKGAEVVLNNWQIMARTMHRKADLKPEEHSSCIARKVARQYEEEAMLIATTHGL